MQDDHKHRGLWRRPYNPEELSELKALVEAAKEEGITFIYGISPGLDMTYSSEVLVKVFKG